MSTTKSKPNRTGVAIMAYVDPKLHAAFVRFIEDQKYPPTQTTVIEAALKTLLVAEGYWDSDDSSA